MDGNFEQYVYWLDQRLVFEGFGTNAEKDDIK